MSERILKYREEVETYCTHIGGKFISRDSSLECHLPNSLGVIHISPEEAYIHGLQSNIESSGEYEVRTNGVKNGSPDREIQSLTSPKRIITTLDDTFGTIEIHDCWDAMSKNGDMFRVEMHFDSDAVLAQNWGDMIPQKRGDKLSSLPDSHHKEIIIREIRAAGFDIAGLED